jgi:CheY-like chemotaxis protein
MSSKVLLVDDSPLILKVAELFLRGKYEIVTATSGHEALEKAATERPNLILMDYHMPGWTGCETRSFLAKDNRTQNIPVVIMTTECQTAELSADVDHLVKPFNAGQLHHKLGEYLEPCA